ncbi:hypothetical protein IE81DRAFT_15201 [Ceraceosorus guamensis]|uniref:Uncharacterized protein n=1 Tax=Ceraceosorus guamensis TaxID=1522189 RepID=A0A316VQ24_9BASI|nr:hypothetical protein IE81DRAFT_15201 [Ceraceosorus guamensis]PWN39632.1 hypothetical protein IE81DRAFT_15201 [Ceraceosorus guamensis]
MQLVPVLLGATTLCTSIAAAPRSYLGLSQRQLDARETFPNDAIRQNNAKIVHSSYTELRPAIIKRGSPEQHLFVDIPEYLQEHVMEHMLPQARHSPRNASSSPGSGKLHPQSGDGDLHHASASPRFSPGSSTSPHSTFETKHTPLHTPAVSPTSSSDSGPLLIDNHSYAHQALWEDVTFPQARNSGLAHGKPNPWPDAPSTRSSSANTATSAPSHSSMRSAVLGHGHASDGDEVTRLLDDHSHAQAPYAHDFASIHSPKSPNSNHSSGDAVHNTKPSEEKHSSGAHQSNGKSFVEAQHGGAVHDPSPQPDRYQTQHTSPPQEMSSYSASPAIAEDPPRAEHKHAAASTRDNQIEVPNQNGTKTVKVQAGSPIRSVPLRLKGRNAFVRTSQPRDFQSKQPSAPYDHKAPYHLEAKLPPPYRDTSTYVSASVSSGQKAHKVPDEPVRILWTNQRMPKDTSPYVAALQHHRKYFKPNMATFDVIQKFTRTDSEPTLHAVGLAYEKNNKPIHGGGVTSIGHHYDETRVYMAPQTKLHLPRGGELHWEDPDPSALVRPSVADSERTKKKSRGQSSTMGADSEQGPSKKHASGADNDRLHRRGALLSRRDTPTAERKLIRRADEHSSDSTKSDPAIDEAKKWKFKPRKYFKPQTKDEAADKTTKPLANYMIHAKDADTSRTESDGSQEQDPSTTKRTKQMSAVLASSETGSAPSKAGASRRLPRKPKDFYRKYPEYAMNRGIRGWTVEKPSPVPPRDHLQPASKLRTPTEPEDRPSVSVSWHGHKGRPSGDVTLAAMKESVEHYAAHYHPTMKRFTVKGQFGRSNTEPALHITGTARDDHGRALPGGGITGIGVPYSHHKVYMKPDIFLPNPRPMLKGQVIAPEEPRSRAMIMSTQGMRAATKKAWQYSIRQHAQEEKPQQADLGAPKEKRGPGSSRRSSRAPAQAAPASSSLNQDARTEHKASSASEEHAIKSAPVTRPSPIQVPDSPNRTPVRSPSLSPTFATLSPLREGSLRSGSKRTFSTFEQMHDDSPLVTDHRALHHSSPLHSDLTSLHGSSPDTLHLGPLTPPRLSSPDHTNFKWVFHHL